MVRVYHEHPDRSPLRPRTHGPIGRFDPHVRDRHRQPREQPDGRGVNYLAETLGCALAESFPDQSPEVAICPSMSVLRAAPTTAVTLLDLTGDGAMRIGAIGTLGSGNEPRKLTQRWGRAIYEQYPSLAGVRYRAAHQGGTAVAAWERAGNLQVPSATVAPRLALLDRGMKERVVVALATQGRYPVAIGAADCQRCHTAAAARSSSSRRARRG